MNSFTKLRAGGFDGSSEVFCASLIRSIQLIKQQDTARYNKQTKQTNKQNKQTNKTNKQENE